MKKYRDLKLSIDQKESIKLMKMSKGYQWEIKTILTGNDEEDTKRLEKIDNQMKEKWGSA